MKKILFSFFIVFLVLVGCSYEENVVYNEQLEEITTEETTEETTEKIPEVYSAKITAVGDLMMHSYQMDSSYDKKKDAFSFDYEFEKVYNYLSNADLTIGNLETVFAGKEIGYSDYPCFNSPREFAEAIKNAGFDVVSTVNNHSMDKGSKGIIGTIDLLDELKIGHFGTYKSQEESEEIFTKDVNGIKIAFVSWTYGVNGNRIPEEYFVNIISEEKIKNDLKKAKSLNPDIIIAVPHLGNEYEEEVRQTFKEWVKIMVDNGADIILASHPHVLQEMEFIETENNKGFVIYSLGNFVSSQRDKPRDAGVILNIELKKTEGEKCEIEKISYIPTWVQWRDTSGEYNIRVLSVYDAIKDYENQNNYGLRQKDYNRLKEVITHSCEILNNEKADFENIKSEYVFYEKGLKEEGL